MLAISRYQDISEVEKEAKKDYIDRHSPFIYCDSVAKKGKVFSVTVKMGDEYAHPDDFDHYISSIALYNNNTLLAKAEFMAGALGGKKGHQTVTFNIIPTSHKLKLTAQSYCTKHGIWESEIKEVVVEE